MSKPPSRKHYEKTKPTYKELENKLAILEHNLINAQSYERELKNALRAMQDCADYLGVLKRSEVMVVTPEGMKYLVGQDLEDFCKAELDKQNLNKVWWGDSMPSTSSFFSGYANSAITKILIDEIEKAPLSANQLDAYKYITKGRYDSGSESKEEGS